VARSGDGSLGGVFSIRSEPTLFCCFSTDGVAAANQEYRQSQYRHETHYFPILYSMGPLFHSAAACFSLMCCGYQDQSVFFTYARLYAFDHMVTTTAPGDVRLCTPKASSPKLTGNSYS
jgi:hypothetical protein